MNEHLAAWQIAEFILGGLDADELDEVYRHFDKCGECVRLAGVDMWNRPLLALRSPVGREPKGRK